MNIAESVLKGIVGSFVRVKFNTSNSRGDMTSSECMGTVREVEEIDEKGKKTTYYSLSQVINVLTFRPISKEISEEILFSTEFRMDNNTTVMIKQVENVITITVTKEDIGTRKCKITLINATL